MVLIDSTTRSQTKRISSKEVLFVLLTVNKKSIVFKKASRRDMILAADSVSERVRKRLAGAFGPGVLRDCFQLFELGVHRPLTEVALHGRRQIAHILLELAPDVRLGPRRFVAAARTRVNPLEPGNDRLTVDYLDIEFLTNGLSWSPGRSQNHHRLLTVTIRILHPQAGIERTDKRRG